MRVFLGDYIAYIHEAYQSFSKKIFRTGRGLCHYYAVQSWKRKDNRKDNRKRAKKKKHFIKSPPYSSLSQCFLLRKMDEKFEFGLKLPATIATFRAGCILQGFLLEPMTKAFEDKPDLENLLSVAWNLKIGTSKLESLK